MAESEVKQRAKRSGKRSAYAQLDGTEPPRPTREVPTETDAFGLWQECVDAETDHAWQWDVRRWHRC